MEKSLLLLLLSGLFSLSGASEYFLLVKINKTWENARSYCREKCIDLATIEEMRYMDVILENIMPPWYAWIGLSSGSSLNWHWSLVEEDSYMEGEMDALNWGNEDSEDCGAYRDEVFYAVNCADKLPAVCCDEKGTLHLTSQNMSWRSAQSHCRTDYTDLVSVRDEATRQTLQTLVGVQQVWTGLFRDLWTWIDGSSSSFRYWKSDQPGATNPKSRRCAKFKSGEWESSSCSEEAMFFCTCEKDVTPEPSLTEKKVLKVRISFKDSGLDLNDPAVKEEILKQMKEKMSLNTVDHMQWTANPDGRVFVKEPKKNGEEIQSVNCEP